MERSEIQFNDALVTRHLDLCIIDLVKRKISLSDFKDLYPDVYNNAVKQLDAVICEAIVKDFMLPANEVKPV